MRVRSLSGCQVLLDPNPDPIKTPEQVWEGSVSGSTLGIGLSLASVLCGAAMLNFSGRALSEKLDVFRCRPSCVLRV